MDDIEVIRGSLYNQPQKNNFFVKNMHRVIINYGEGELANQLMDTLVKLPLLKIDRKDLETYQIVYLAEKRVNR